MHYKKTNKESFHSFKFIQIKEKKRKFQTVQQCFNYENQININLLSLTHARIKKTYYITIIIHASMQQMNGKKKRIRIEILNRNKKKAPAFFMRKKNKAS